MAGLVFKNYSLAIFNLTKENNKVETIYTDLKMLLSVLDNSYVMDFICDTSKPKDDRKDIINETFKDKIDDILLDSILFIIDKNRADILLLIMNDLLRLIKEELGIAVIYVTSAKELSDSQKDKIKQQFLKSTNYNQIEDNYIIDESIIGGLRIRLGSKLMDKSVSKDINRLKNILK